MVTLKKRFTLMFALIVALPILLICQALSWLYMNALLETVLTNTRSLMEEVSQSIENELVKVSMLTATLIYDKELVQDAVSFAGSASEGEKIAAYWKLNERLGAIFAISNSVGAIAVYMRDGSVVPVSNYPNIRSFTLSDRAAFSAAMETREKVVVADNLSGVTENGVKQFILSAFVSPSPENGGSAIDAILVMFRTPYLDRFLYPGGKSTGASLSVLSRDRNLLLSGLPENTSPAALSPLADPSFSEQEIKIDGASYLVCTSRVDIAGWTLVLTKDKASVTGRIMAYQWYLLPAIAVMCGLFFAYSLVFFSRVVAPIAGTIENMRRFGSGMDPVPVDSTGIKELEALGENFDRMVLDIKRLDAERTEQNDRRLAAEIQALQFQISPHFIANTLNAIRMAAIASRNDAIRDMSKGLMRVLKQSYQSAGSLATLAEEIENVESYVAIMKVRFGGHFSIEYALAPETLDRKLLRMCLQPIVENAILHGLSESLRPGLLTIRSKLLPNGDLEVEVEDNGIGMDQGKADRLLEAKSPGRMDADGPEDGGSNRIGMQNVRNRLSLNFGSRGSLAVNSAPGVGTTVKLTFPC